MASYYHVSGSQPAGPFCNGPSSDRAFVAGCSIPILTLRTLCELVVFRWSCLCVFGCPCALALLVMCLGPVRRTSGRATARCTTHGCWTTRRRACCGGPGATTRTQPRSRHPVCCMGLERPAWACLACAHTPAKAGARATASWCFNSGCCRVLRLRWAHETLTSNASVSQGFQSAVGCMQCGKWSMVQLLTTCGASQCAPVVAVQPQPGGFCAGRH